MAEYLKESFWVLFLPSGKSCTSYYPSLNIAASLITPFYWPNGWPWLFTNFPSLRDCYSNLRLLIRTNILCGQHFLSWILRLEKCSEQWARSQKTWFCSLLGYNVILDHSPSLGSDSPCAIDGVECDELCSHCFFPGAPGFISLAIRIQLAKHCEFFFVVFMNVRHCGLVYCLSFSICNNSQILVPLPMGLALLFCQCKL